MLQAEEGAKPEPSKVCHSTCHTLPALLDPAHRPRHGTGDAFRLEGAFSHQVILTFLVKGKRSAVLKVAFTEIIKASFNIAFHFSSPAPPGTYKTGLDGKKVCV